jgi:acid stress-induced BolA-like protein IbaG/YrbA
MENLAQKVKNALLESFPESAIDLDDTDDDRVLGFVVSPEFRRKSALTRQNMIWRLLNKHLKADERRRILGIMTMTPEEEVAYSE